MAMPEIPNLSDSDIKILIACIEPRTKNDVSVKTGIPFKYCEKRMTMLRAKMYLVQAKKPDRRVYYLTNRRPETESFFMLGSPTGKSLVHEIPFYGELTTLVSAISRVGKRAKNSKADGRLYDVLKRIICSLAVRSYMKSQGNDFGHQPDEERLREHLANYIQQTEMELTLAKEIYNRTLLWSGNESVWKMISETPPPEDWRKLHHTASKFFGDVK